MGDQRAIRGRLRCCAGCSGTAFYFRCLSRRGHGTSTNGWTGAMLALAAIFFPSFLLIAGGAAFLGSSPFGAGLPVRSERRQRRRGRTPVDRVVYPCLDQLDPFSRRFRPWTRCVWTSDVLAMSPVAGCCVHRRWGRSDGPYLTVNAVAFQKPPKPCTTLRGMRATERAIRSPYSLSRVHGKGKGDLLSWWKFGRQPN